MFLNSQIEDQINAEQPNIFLVLFIFITPAFILTQATRLLLLNKGITEYVSNNPIIYNLSFFLTQSLIMLIASFYFLRKYPTALYSKNSIAIIRNLKKTIIIAAPLIIFYAYGCVKSVNATSSLAQVIGNHPNQFDDIKNIFIEINQKALGNLAYGATSLGIILSSISSFITPIFEEIIITGIAYNYISRFVKWHYAVVITAITFSMLHIIAFGFGLHIISLFFCSITYILTRIKTGHIAYSIISHLIINFIIFLPKWFLLAVTYLLIRNSGT